MYIGLGLLCLLISSMHAMEKDKNEWQYQLTFNTIPYELRRDEICKYFDKPDFGQFKLVDQEANSIYIYWHEGYLKRISNYCQQVSDNEKITFLPDSLITTTYGDSFSCIGYKHDDSDNIPYIIRFNAIDKNSLDENEKSLTINPVYYYVPSQSYKPAMQYERAFANTKLLILCDEEHVVMMTYLDERDPSLYKQWPCYNALAKIIIDKENNFHVMAPMNGSSCHLSIDDTGKLIKHTYKIPDITQSDHAIKNKYNHSEKEISSIYNDIDSIAPEFATYLYEHCMQKQSESEKECLYQYQHRLYRTTVMEKTKTSAYFKSVNACKHTLGLPENHPVWNKKFIRTLKRIINDKSDTRSPLQLAYASVIYYVGGCHSADHAAGWRNVAVGNNFLDPKLIIYYDSSCWHRNYTEQYEKLLPLETLKKAFYKELTDDDGKLITVYNLLENIRQFPLSDRV